MKIKSLYLHYVISVLIILVILLLSSKLDEYWKTTINERLHILDTSYFPDPGYHE